LFTVNYLPGLGPQYAKHFAELADVLQDWSNGATPPLLKREKRSPSLTSLESRAIANIILAVEAIRASHVSLSDFQKDIGDNSEAISEVLREFKPLKQWVNERSMASNAEEKIEEWQRDFSRKSNPRGVGANEAATELLTAGRQKINEYAIKNDIGALHEIARRCAKWAISDATGMGVG
jgi:hypothetical protein